MGHGAVAEDEAADVKRIGTAGSSPLTDEKMMQFVNFMPPL